MLTDPGYCQADRAGRTDSSTLGRGRSPPIATTPAHRPRELSIAFQPDKPPDEYRELARAVEDYGFDVLSMYSDLTFQPPIVPLTVAALATDGWGSNLGYNDADNRAFALAPPLSAVKTYSVNCASSTSTSP